MNTYEALINFLRNKENKQAFEAVLFKALHQSWCQVNKTAPKTPSASWDTQEAHILAWGYELKLNADKIVGFLDFKLSRLRFNAQLAFWEAIRISGVSAILNITIDAQDLKGWALTCAALKTNLFLRELGLRISYYQVSDASWQLFWDAIGHSSIKHLALDGDEFLGKKFSKTFFNGLSRSHLDFLSLNNMNLYDLTSSQWEAFYQAVKASELIGLHLRLNSLIGVDQGCVIEKSISWARWCEIISLPSLKHLVFRGLDCTNLSDNEWNLLCKALSKSHLESLDFAIDSYNPCANGEQWIKLLKALKKTTLRKLTLATYSADSFTSLVLAQFCDMLVDSELAEVSLYTETSELVFSEAEWRLLGEALKCKKIGCFDFGPIELSKESHFKHFAKGLMRSGIRHLCLKNGNLAKISPDSWKEFASLLKALNLISLNMLGDNCLHTGDSSFWSTFCKFIEKSGIKELTCSLGACDKLEFEKANLLSKTIQSSRLECLNLGPTIAFSLDKMPWSSFAVLCNAIKSKACKIRTLTLGDMNDLSSDKKNLLAETLEVVNSRAVSWENSKKTLKALCAKTLFEYCNAQYTKTGITLILKTTLMTLIYLKVN